MHADTYRYLHDIFQMRRYEPEGPNSRILAEHAQSSQKENYSRVSGAILSFAANQKINRLSNVGGIQNIIAIYIDNMFSKSPVGIFGSEKSLYVSGNIPLIIDGVVKEPSKFIMEGGEDDLYFCFAAALFYETARSGILPNNGNAIPFELTREIASYAGWLAVDGASGQVDYFVHEQKSVVDAQTEALKSSVGQALEDADKQIGSRIGGLETRVETLGQRIEGAINATEDATNKAATFESQIIDLAKKTDAMSASIDAKIADSEDKVDAFLASAEARSTYENLKIHWLDRSSSARQAFFWSSTVLAVVLIVIPLIAMVNKAAVFAFMKDLSDLAGPDLPTDAGPIHLTVATIGRLVVITIPLALYFWLIRLVVRFNSRSLILMDDAGLRATMIETYYKMIEKSAATPEDRALVLSALMRPAPGHGSDPIDPPNFTEVMDKAMGK